MENDGCFSPRIVLTLNSSTTLTCKAYPYMVFLSLCTRRFDVFAVCTMAVVLVADRWRTVCAITDRWNALGTSEQWTSSAVTTRGSIINCGCYRRCIDCFCKYYIFTLRWGLQFLCSIHWNRLYCAIRLNY